MSRHSEAIGQLVDEIWCLLQSYVIHPPQIDEPIITQSCEFRQQPRCVVARCIPNSSDSSYRFFHKPARVSRVLRIGSQTTNSIEGCIRQLQQQL